MSENSHDSLALWSCLNLLSCLISSSQEILKSICQSDLYSAKLYDFTDFSDFEGIGLLEGLTKINLPRLRSTCLLPLQPSQPLHCFLRIVNFRQAGIDVHSVGEKLTNHRFKNIISGPNLAETEQANCPRRRHHKLREGICHFWRLSLFFQSS